MLQFVCVKKMVSENPQKGSWPLKRCFFCWKCFFDTWSWSGNFFPGHCLNWKQTVMVLQGTWLWVWTGFSFLEKHWISVLATIYPLHTRLKLWQVNWLEGELIQFFSNKKHLSGSLWCWTKPTPFVVVLLQCSLFS